MTIMSFLSKVFRKPKREEISMEPHEPIEKPELLEPNDPIRPTCYVRSIEFQSGQKLLINMNEVIVIVGPNNSGKSCTLREIKSALRNGERCRGVILNTVDFVFSAGNMAEWLKKNARFSETNGLYLVEGINSVITEVAIDMYWRDRNERGINDLSELFCNFLSTEERLTRFNETQLPNYYERTSTHPLHKIYRDEKLEEKLNEIFLKAFRRSTRLNRSAGSVASLELRDVESRGQDVERSQFGYARLSQQGDGVRAFAGVIGSVLASDADLLLIDEPEAFLHPPQIAVLARLLAREVPVGRQQFIATHSIDFLRAILDQRERPVRILRLSRGANGGNVKELSSEALRSVWQDSLLRYSRVLDGLFHDGVVVCESDSDCHFYAALLEAIEESDLGRRDLAFVHGAGKSRIPTIVRALKAIGVQTRVVTDFDILGSEKDLVQICEALGGAWSDVQRDFKVVKSSIEQRRTELSTAETREAISSALNRVKSSSIPEGTIREIKQIIGKSSAWSEAKKLGKTFIPTGDASAAYQQLESKLRDFGLFIVPVGELESFYRSSPNHGPAWLPDVLELDLKTASELTEARDFVRALTRGF